MKTVCSDEQCLGRGIWQPQTDSFRTHSPQLCACSCCPACLQLRMDQSILCVYIQGGGSVLRIEQGCFPVQDIYQHYPKYLRNIKIIDYC